MTGFNSSGDFPTLDAFQPVQGSGFNGFVTALTPSGSKLVHSSFLGGAGRGIAVDASGQAYVAGMTNLAANIPTSFLSYGGGQDAFVHFSGIQGDGFRTLAEGAKVEYEVGETGKGPQATNVRII